jgi:hypothetical protein
MAVEGEDWISLPRPPAKPLLDLAIPLGLLDVFGRD